MAITVVHSLPSIAVIAARYAVIAARGRFPLLSLDNGSEVRSRAFNAWAADYGIALQFIQPGRPVQNAHVKSFNGKFRDECLSQHWFHAMHDVRFHIERYRRHFNTARPYEACRLVTPLEFAKTFIATPG